MADQIQVEDGVQRFYVLIPEIVRMGRPRGQRLFDGDPFYAFQPGSQQLVGLLLDPGGDLVPGRSAIWRIVLKAAVRRRVVRRRDDDAVRHSIPTAAVVFEDGERDGGGRYIVAISGDHGVDTVGGQHFQGRIERR